MGGKPCQQDGKTETNPLSNSVRSTIADSLKMAKNIRKTHPDKQDGPIVEGFSSTYSPQSDTVDFRTQISCSLSFIRIVIRDA